MKSLIASFVFLSTMSASAGQSIVCREVTQRGTLRANGGAIQMDLQFNQNGSLSTVRSRVGIKGFTRRSSETFGSARILSANQSRASTTDAYTTLFLDTNANLPLDIQLQFNARILRKSFRSLPASFVIGSEDANPETGFAFGYDVICNSRVN